MQSVAQSSFDAWVKYYRQDENTPNATVSYYTKGALVALCLDLTLRAEGKTTLDQLMRALWARSKAGSETGPLAGPMSQADLLAVLRQLGGRSFEAEIAAWVHSTDELPLKRLLEASGVVVHEDPAQLAQALGLRVAEASGIVVKAVLRGGAAEQAGFLAGDEWLGVEVGTGKAASAWRIQKLDDLGLYVAASNPAKKAAPAPIKAMVARDKRLLTLPLTIPAKATTWRLSGNAEVVATWLKSI